MGIIFNPGSEHKGGTFEIAKLRAEQLLKRIERDGILDVELLRSAKSTEVGWEFRFKHKVTGKVVLYDTHGFFPIEDAHHKDYGFSFCPRDYWDGTSFGEPKAEDFLIAGYRVEVTQRLVAA